MATFDLTEIESEFIDTLNADSGLTALLANTQSVHRGYPPVAKPFPLVVVECASNPTEPPGLLRCDWTISVYAPRVSQCNAVIGYLDANYEIPRRRGCISSDSYRLDQLHRRNAMETGPFQVLDTGENLHAIHSEWRARVVWTGGGSSGD